MFASLYLSRLIIGDCAILMVSQRECFPGSCQKWITVSVLDPATLSSKSAGRLRMCTNALEHARLEKQSLVLALVSLQQACVLYQDHFLVWKTPLHFPLPAFPFFPLLPSEVSSAYIGSYNSLCFLLGKHVLVSSVVIPSRFATDGCAKRDWLRIT